MTDVFISYSRKDKPFVQQLHTAIAAEGREAWVDWEGIPLTADWWAEIQEGIETADAFVFVISPDSAASTVCAQEVDHANKHNKRIAPIVYRDVSPQELPTSLSRLNWVFFRESDDFDSAFAALMTAMDADYEWVKAHTRLVRRAAEWDRQGRDDSYLLRGTDLAVAEQSLTQQDKEPSLSHLQIEYILSGRQRAEAERRKEREAQEQGRKARRRIVLIIASLFLTILIVAVNYIGVKPAADRIDLTSDVRLPTTLAATEAQKHLLLMFGDLRSYILSGDAQYWAGYDRNRQLFETNLRNLTDLYALSPNADVDGQGRLADLLDTYEEWTTLTAHVIETPAGRITQEAALHLPQAERQTETMRGLLADMTDEQQQLLEDDLNTGSESLERATQRSLFIGLIVIILGAGIIWVEIRGLPSKNRWQHLLGLSKRGD